MKTNLKNFPSIFLPTTSKTRIDVLTWKNAFEAELREIIEEGDSDRLEALAWEILGK